MSVSMSSEKAKEFGVYSARHGDSVKISSVISICDDMALVCTQKPHRVGWVKKKYIYGDLSEILIERPGEDFSGLEEWVFAGGIELGEDCESVEQIIDRLEGVGLATDGIEEYAKVIYRINSPKKKRVLDVSSVNSINWEDQDTSGLILDDRLYGFQKKGVAAIVNSDSNILLADEMGLGKSVQAIYSAANINKWPALVVSPSSVKYNWKNEIYKWRDELESVEIIEGQSGMYQIQKWNLINWAILDHRVEGLKDIDWGIIIFDEIHKAKNHTANRSRAAKELSKTSDCKILGLSGTPLMNKPSELRHQLEILKHPLGQMPHRKFCRKLCGGFSAPFGFKEDYLPNAKTNIIGSLISDITIKRKKDEQFDNMPDLVRGFYEIQISDEYERLFNEELKDFKEYYHKYKKNEGPADEEDNILVRINDMRQLSAMGKAPAVAKNAREAISSGEQILLFSDFLHPLDLIEDKIGGDDNVHIERITGGVNSSEKHEIGERFNNEDCDTNLLLCTSAAEEGMNLVGADEVWFLTLNWTPAVHRQREDRAHRHGRKETVIVRYFECDLKVDEYIVKMLEDKLEMVEDTFGKDPHKITDSRGSGGKPVSLLANELAGE